MVALRKCKKVDGVLECEVKYPKVFDTVSEITLIDAVKKEINKIDIEDKTLKEQLKKDEVVITNDRIEKEKIGDDKMVYYIKENERVSLSFPTTDSCHLNFGDGNSEYFENCSKVTHIYKKPGVYKVKNGEIEKVVIVENSSTKFFSGYVSGLNNYLEESENPNDFYDNGTLYIAPSLSDIGYYWTNFRYVNHKKINLDSSNFTLITKVKNSLDEGGIEANDVGIALFTDKGASISATMMGQSWGKPWIGMRAGDSKANELDELILDFERWQILKLQVKNNKFTLYVINSTAKQGLLGEPTDTQIKELYSIDANEELGNIVGISYGFKGSGRVDYVKLLDGNGNVVYKDDFDKNLEEANTIALETTTSTDDLDFEVFKKYIDGVKDFNIEDITNKTFTLYGYAEYYHSLQDMQKITISFNSSGESDWFETNDKRYFAKFENGIINIYNEDGKLVSYYKNLHKM